MKKLLSSLLLVTGIYAASAQAPSCDPNVPFFQVNLTGQPAGQWSSPTHSRQGDCCTDNRCTSFEVILDTGAAMVEIGFDIITDPSQAIPSGSLNYQVNCGALTPVGSPICISGVGPHYITFCKPGANTNTYYVRSIPKPIFPRPDTTRIGCFKTIQVLGLVQSSVTWQSIFPGTPGQYNTYLSCTSNCTSPVYTPATGAPAFVDYLVCGSPIAAACGYVAACDTVRMYNIGALTASVTPDPGTFCSGGPGVTLTVTAAGGLNPYSYTWRDQLLNTVSTSNSYSTNIGGTYSVEVRDMLYDPSGCPGVFVNVPVVEVQPPVVNAGSDQVLCPGSNIVLNGSVQNATGGIWSGGAGTFSPDNISLLTSYVPTPAEIASGSVTLTLTSTGAGGGCTNASDQVVISFPTALSVTVNDLALNCHGDSATLGAAVSGGITPYTYAWSNGAVTSSVFSGQGTYCVTVTDSLGCIATDCGNITEPAALTISMSSTDCSVNGGNDGTASTIAGGGTGPYTYNWTPGNPAGDGTANITGLFYGIYSVSITDANGCSINSSVVVNEPRCAGFQATASGTDVNCFNGETGTATATVISGTGPYTYAWDDPQNQVTQTALNLPAGVYQVTVTDQSNGCVHISNITITEPSQLYTTTTQSNVTTIGGNDGSATVNGFGGTPGYSYLWSNSATTQTISSLIAGTYSVTVTDANGCTTQNSVLINQPPCNNLTAAVNTNPVSCNGGSNGSASAVVLFATNPVQYLWSTGATTSSVSGLPAGSYSVSVTDASNCQAIVNFTITEPSALTASTISTDISCNGFNNGSVELFVSGGIFPYSYQWSNGLAVQDQIDLTAGTYSATVTDANGCTATANATINEPTLITAASTISNVSCFGGTNGAIDIAVNGGNGGYTYLWSNAASSQDITGLGVGLYTVTVTDINGCTQQSPFTFYIIQPDSLHATGVVTNLTCFQSGTGSIDFTMSGGETPYTYTWSNAATTQDISSLAAGVYNVSVTDSNGCVRTASFTVTEPAQLTASTAATTNFNGYQVSCNGNTDGAINLTAGGGTTGYSFAWSNAATTEDISGVGAGTYNVTVTDANGCTATSSVTLTQPNALGTTTVITPVLCNGNATGAVDLAVSGGVTTYNYVWSNAATSEDIGGLTAGTYSVTVTDANGCTTTTSVSITQPTSLALSGTVTNLTCFQSANGAIDLAAAGGTPGYTYNWSNAATTEDVSSLAAGSYSVTITDANNCTSTASFTITEPSQLTAATAATTNFNGYQVSCNGSVDGAIDLTVAGGISGYSFSWSNAATTEDISGVGAGTYNVTVTDANGCTATSSVTLTQPNALGTTTVITPVLCNGNATGAVDLAVSGGVTTYNYVWSNAATSEDISGLVAGTYSVTVTDANGCTTTTSVSITQPTSLALSGTVTDLTCFQSANGAIDLAAAGGTPGYTYNWSNAATTEDVSSLAAGSYSVTITDANNCTSTASFTITEPSQLTAATAATTNFNGYQVSCNGSVDGAIDLTAAGGTTGYSFSWSNAAVTEDISGVGAGTYSVTVTDANGCTAISSITLLQPAALNASIAATPVLCFGDSTASINLSVSGGVTVYNYAWSNGATAEDITGLAAGSYNVTITDANGCTATTGTVITEPPVLAATGLVTGLTCYQSGNGSIDLTVSGGTPGYSFTWNNAATTEDIFSLQAGTFSVLVIDAGGCSETLSFTVSEPAALIASAVAATDFNGYQVSCNGSADGAIDLTVSGGTSGYTFLWSNGSTNEDITGLAAGTYTVNITDANGCTASDMVVMNQPAALNFTATHIDVPCNGFFTGSIDVTMNGGVAPFSYLWSNSQATQDIDSLGAGFYTVNITDANGCPLDTVIEITQSAPIIVTTTSGNVLCNGDSTGMINLAVSGATPPYTYAWSNGATSEDLPNIPAGTYSVLVLDSNNCSFADTFAIAQPDALSGNLATTLYSNGFNVSGYGTNDGGINLSVEGGTIPYTYSWSNGSTTEDIAGLPGGNYTVTITDSNGCSMILSAVLSEPDALEMPTGYSPNFDGLNDFFVVHGIEAFRDNSLEVFNRWGNRVFSAEAYNNTWAGTTDSGDVLPDGTYFVVLSINEGAIVLKGYVDIRR